MEQCTLQAYAKINLGLDVTGILENGYHEVRMIMQTVGIFDELEIRRIPYDAQQAAGEQIVVSTDTKELSGDQNNLIYQAAKLMIETYGITAGVQIQLKKNIPIAAGMAGGSTDAAATMKGINELFGLKLSREELMKLGVRLGADVPYCILGGTALAEGIGEKLTVLPAVPDCFLVVAKPDLSVSTQEVYRQLDAAPIQKHPDIDGMIGAIEAGSLEGVVSLLGNVLEQVTVTAHPIIDTLKKRMLMLGAKGSLMSGSGPTVFGIFAEEQQAQEAFAQIQKEGLAKQLFVTTSIN